MSKEIDYVQLGLKIKEIRKSKSITQSQLAEMVDVNPSHISNMENAYTKVSLSVLVSVANALETSVDYILYGNYSNTKNIIEKEILFTIKELDEKTKEKVLKIIEVIKNN
ncbi:MAG: helix-turn-helix domain-containing protein [Lachnospirales bacterium]